ncbi:MAG TPA: hypothetical protein VIV63_16640 [Steroidobacteraceae bacterium]
MLIVHKQMRRVGLAVVAVGAIGLSGQAFADGTPSGDIITNTATVNYTVATVAQTPITASTAFTVDTIVRFNLTGGVQVDVASGQPNGVQMYTLTNTSNATSQFTLTPTNLAGDDFQMNTPGAGTAGVNVYADTNGNGVYNAGTDVQVTANVSLANAGSAVYFLVGDTPLTATNGQIAQVQMAVQAINPATSAAWVNDTNPDTQGGVVGYVPQIVVGNNTATRPGSFRVQTATLAITKSSSVISDPINNTGAGRKAIPGAIMQYQILVANTGATAATLQNVSDTLPPPASIVFRQGDFTGATDIEIQVGANPPTYCIAQSGADVPADGCFRTGNTLTIQAPAITSVAPGSQVAVRFRMTIQ